MCTLRAIARVHITRRMHTHSVHDTRIGAYPTQPRVSCPAFGGINGRAPGHEVIGGLERRARPRRYHGPAFGLVLRVRLATCSPRARFRQLTSEHGTYKTVKARFWPWFSGKSPQHLLTCSLFARKRTERKLLQGMLGSGVLSHIMYLLISFMKSTPQQNRQLNT